MNALYIKWINVFISSFFVLVFLCDAFSFVILLWIGIPIELEGESSMISVCMATYNGEKYLKDQLDSILKQIQSSDEVIISDDGSNDSTRYIIEKFQKKYKNIYLVDGPKRGVQKNFENALKHARGDILFLSDQDDIWMDGKVERVLKEFENSKTLCVVHDAEIVDGNMNKVKDSFFELKNGKPGLLHNLYRNAFIGCCMAFRKCVFEKSYPFPDHIEMHDWWIGLVAECMGNTVFIYEPYLKYRRHGDNASSLHHHPLKKMIFNRLYFIEQLVIRWIQVGWHA